MGIERVTKKGGEVRCLWGLQGRKRADKKSKRGLSALEINSKARKEGSCEKNGEKVN